MKMSSILSVAAGLGALIYLYANYERSHSSELEKALKKQEHEISELKREMLEKQKDEADKAALAAQKSREEKSRGQDVVKKKLAQLRQTLKQRQDEAEDVQVALQGTPSGRSEKDSLNDLGEEIKAEKAVIANLKNSLKKLDGEREKNLKEGQGILNQNKTTYQQLSHDLIEQIKLHQEMVGRYRADLNAMKSRMRDPVIREQANLIQAKINEENKTVVELKEKLANLNYQWDQVKAETGANSGRGRQYDDLKRQLAGEESKLNELTQQQKAQKSEYVDESSHFEKLRADLKKKQDEILALQAEMAALEKQLSPP